MERERDEHPANVLNRQLFSLDNRPKGQTWWKKFTALLDQVEQLTDPRSVASFMYIAALTLAERKEVAPKETELIDKVREQKVIPLWEKEVVKNDNWTGIARRVEEFISLVPDEPGKRMAAWGANTLTSVWPNEKKLAQLFPDDNVNSLLDAVTRGEKRWLFRMDEMYRFCDTGQIAENISKLCEMRGWTKESEAWMEIGNHFNKLLVKADLPALNPKLVEMIYEKVMTANLEPDTAQIIKKRVTMWRLVRNKRYKGLAGNENLLRVSLQK
jgi:hypothetical protein